MCTGAEIALMASAAASFGSAAIGNKQSVTSTTTAPNTMDPMYKILSPWMMGNAIKTGQGMQGWGGSQMFNWNPMTAGGGMNGDILAMLAKALPEIMKGMNTTAPTTAHTRSRPHQVWNDRAIFG